MRYFPDPISGWLFLGALASVLAVASYTDERYTKVPKWLTIPALALGFLISCARGAWAGAHGLPGWYLEGSGAAVGALDGLLFAGVGFMVGFAIFFGVWLLGGCGGGDVKLFAALGAWLGPYLVFWVLIVSMVLLAFCLIFVIAFRLIRGSPAAPPTEGPSRRRKSSVIVRFGLVAAVAVLLVAAWAFRVDLGLAKPRAAAPLAEVGNHAR